MRTLPLVVIVGLTVMGCDRFRHPRYENNPWGTTTGSTDHPSPETTADEPLPPPPTTVIVTGSSSSTPAPPPSGGRDQTCGGVTYNNASCDSCIRERCCDEAIACSQDSTCNGLDSCRDACATDDEECVDACESLYFNSTSASTLDRCLVSECSSVCE